MRIILKTLIPAAVIAMAAGCSSADAVPQAEWSVTNGFEWPEGGPAYIQTFRFTNLPDSAQAVAFNMFARTMTPLCDTDTIEELVPGYYAIRSSRIASAQPADTVEVAVLTRGILKAIAYGPDGVHGISKAGHTFDIALERADILADSTALSYAVAPDSIFRRNEELAGARRRVYDVVPSFKSVALGGDSSLVDMNSIRFESSERVQGTERYFITVADGAMTVEADTAQWRRLDLRLRHYLGNGPRMLPDAVIADEPDFGYRGLMIDVVRNFQPAGEMHRILDLMALYGLNTLHFHLTDDEAWRFEVAALPELTAVGSRRGYTRAGDETDCLPQIFAGNGNPASIDGTANGYYTRQQMVELLRHANELAIRVIPEIESPGHGRAAIVALRNRPDYRLDDVADTSRYTSAQSFHDNVMNPALPGPYRLMEIVADELASIYAEAGAPLEAIHIGGDEVPRNAWGGSPAVAALKDSLGLADDKAVHAHFVSRVAEIMEARGLKISGWQEIALRHPEEYNSEMVPKVFSVNCWSTLGESGRRVVADIARAGFPAVLSNVNHFYLDMCYSPHPYERGLSWGGYVDEFDALHGYPAQLASGLQPIGIQGQLFAETIRSEAGLETLLLPKMLGMAERAWNADSTYTDAQLNTIIADEMPRWEAAGLTWHVRQPGLVLRDNMLVANSSYPEAEIYVTFDGSNPDRSSQRVEAGTPTAVPAGAAQIRAIQYVGPHASVVTVL